MNCRNEVHKFDHCSSASGNAKSKSRTSLWISFNFGWTICQHFYLYKWIRVSLISTSQSVSPVWLGILWFISSCCTFGAVTASICSSRADPAIFELADIADFYFSKKYQGQKSSLSIVFSCRARRSGWVGSTTLISSAPTLRSGYLTRNRILTVPISVPLSFT